MAINDLYTDGIASGWQVLNAASFTEPRSFEADVVIIGSGAGGGTAAEILSNAGLTVLIVEEGPLKTAASFKDFDEARAFRELYQEAGARTTADGSVALLQGRSVGGTTTVNWTSSFRTPAETLVHWASEHHVVGCSESELAPWFAQMEARLGILPWAVKPNANNAALKTACEKLGWEWHVIPRNVKGCWDSGYCGFGCPANAKQSMLVSTIPAALAKGAVLIHHLKAERLQLEKGRVVGLQARALDADCVRVSGAAVTIRAQHFVLAAGALNSPALLMRSEVPDPHGRLGKRSMIHPVNLSLAQMPERVDAYYGAPQSIASDEFQWRGAHLKDGMGFKLEVPPMPPGLASSIFLRFGAGLAEDLAGLTHTQAVLALGRDGFHPQSTGGEVKLGADGNPVLDYPLNDYHWQSFKKAFQVMAQAQFAAGAQRVKPAHLHGEWVTSLAAARAQIEQLNYQPLQLTLFSAHLMGGCAMGENPRHAVVNSSGAHHQLENLSVFDGSVFPTSIGANPQLSIYGLVARNASQLAAKLSGASVITPPADQPATRPAHAG